MRVIGSHKVLRKLNKSCLDLLPVFSEGLLRMLSTALRSGGVLLFSYSIATLRALSVFFAGSWPFSIDIVEMVVL